MKLFILCFCVAINLNQIFGHPDNSEVSEGQRCKLDNDQFGICKNPINCNYALALLNQKQGSELSRCQFQGLSRIVCCPETATPPDLEITAPFYPEIAPPPEINLIPYPKSIKFKKALCKGEDTKPFKYFLALNIIGGQHADVTEFPFQVALGYLNLDGIIEYNCGGSLIADDIVLTAAHCANRKDVSPITVKLGRVSLVNDEYDFGDDINIGIESIILHPQYRVTTKYNDIAIIKLKRPTEKTEFIEPACLSTANRLPKNFTITGFGKNDTNTNRRINWLLKATVNIYSFERCKNDFKSLHKELIEQQCCALGYKGADACQGDSGGPMSYKIDGNSYLYGIVSFGAGCGGSLPGIYTKVDQYFKWIDNEMYKIEQSSKN